VEVGGRAGGGAWRRRQGSRLMVRVCWGAAVTMTLVDYADYRSFRGGVGRPVAGGRMAGGGRSQRGRAGREGRRRSRAELDGVGGGQWAWEEDDRC
jgi:hypothetical protein